MRSRKEKLVSFRISEPEFLSQGAEDDFIFGMKSTEIAL